MECPKCAFVQDTDFIECPHCGIVVAKFLRAHDHVQGSAFAAAARPDDAAPRERIIRAVALPGALILARLLVAASPGSVRMVSMWVHESGHAATAWLCGYPAFPGPWVTPVSPERSLVLSLVLVAALGVGVYRAWLLGRAFWVIAFSVTLLVLLYCTLRVNHVNARQLITFGGDGGCFVLGTLMMLTMYARADHPIRANQIRWALLVFGALAFMDAYAVWSGPIDRLPFGEDENGISDPSVLVEMDGWNVLMLIHRYLGLARACFAVLAVVYVAMLVRDGIRRGVVQ